MPEKNESFSSRNGEAVSAFLLGSSTSTKVRRPWLLTYRLEREAAVGQIQLDVYGELIETLHTAREAELAPLADAWRLQSVLLDHPKTIWRKPDNGIWEVRGEPRAFTHSRLMCCVAFDRAIKSDICENGFDAKRNSFTQHYGGKALDASLLLIPQVGFLPADDPRVAGTITAIEQELVCNGSCCDTRQIRSMMESAVKKVRSSPAAFDWPTPSARTNC